MPRKRKTPKPEAEVPGLSRPSSAAMSNLPAEPANEAAANSAAPSQSSSSSYSSANSTNKAPVYFWKETDPRRGYLCQWYHFVPFYDPSDSEAKIYRSAEHYMMHHKALLFGDVVTAADILKTGSPRKVKDLGRAVQGYDETTWNANKERIVRRGNVCKFTYPVADSELGGEAEKVWKLGTGIDAKEIRASSFRQVLLCTGDRELVEASPFDAIWGIGYREEDAEQNREKWGENLLGKALMAVREEFRKEEAVKD
ncbi:hypothetical protein AB5N19_07437 [Seiridium cardinale]|uniref:NADAR domain-containing protein n=1 Tax=Seiridium cardinale TaxID=138064 RepID=A0ABR2Y4X3_9PEZI